MISDDELRKLMALADDATDGPWESYRTAKNGCYKVAKRKQLGGGGGVGRLSVLWDVGSGEPGGRGDAESNAAYIAASDPTTVSAMAAEILAARERIRAMEWRPIESAPRDGTKFIACTHEGDMRVDSWNAAYCTTRFWLERGNPYDPKAPERYAYWMPLPAGPKG